MRFWLALFVVLAVGVGVYGDDRWPDASASGSSQSNMSWAVETSAPETLGAKCWLGHPNEAFASLLACSATNSFTTTSHIIKTPATLSFVTCLVLEWSGAEGDTIVSRIEFYNDLPSGTPDQTSNTFTLTDSNGAGEYKFACTSGCTFDDATSDGFAVVRLASTSGADTSLDSTARILCTAHF